MSSVRITKERTMEGPTSSVRTTTYESKTSYDSEGAFPFARKSTMGPRNVIIQRTAAGPGGLQGSISRSYSSSYHAGAGGGMQPGGYQVVSQTGVNQVKDSRVKEKKDMQDLNERFASYIEKVRFLEAQNRKLADELEKLKAKWGKETSAIKAMYQAELDEARKLLDDAEKEKAGFQIRLDSKEQELEELKSSIQDIIAESEKYKEAYEQVSHQLIDKDAEIATLRKRVEILENDKARDKAEIAKLKDLLTKARIDLDNETLAHIDAENRRQTLEEELEFLKQVHEQEMKELAALAYRDTTQENREFWKNEMGNALREIQDAYDEKLVEMKGELETYYNMKVQEFRTGSTRQGMETQHAREESKRLRTQLADLRAKLSELEAENANLKSKLSHAEGEYEIRVRELEEENRSLTDEVAKLRAEMEAILKELQDLMDTKLGLELEIAAYRKLLEGEENRIGLKQVVDSWVSSGSVETTEDSSLRVSQVVKGEMSAKTTYQRSAKGPVSISECDAQGRFITLENTGRKEEQLGEWQVRRNIDGSDKSAFMIPKQLVMRPGSRIKIWAKGQKPRDAPSTDIEANQEPSWGMGANITTKLCNQGGEDRATHIQKTIYTS